MLRFRWLTPLVVFLFVGAVVVQAQDTSCPVLVQQALATVEDVCSGLERNEACYGHQSLQADVVGDIRFDTVGDIAALENIERLTLSGLDEANAVWGVSVLSVQANLPDTLPGQNVTFLLFGDMSIENVNAATSEAVEVPGVENPIAIGSTITGVIDDATPEVVYGFQAEAGTIINITLNSTDSALDPYLILRDGNGNTLAENDDSEGLNSAIMDFTIPETGVYLIAATRFGFAAGSSSGGFELSLASSYAAPMQAFYLTSGIGDAACAEAPESGLLVQTPDGAGEVRFLINEVQIDIGSTVFVQAQPNNIMQVRVLEGRARVEAFGVARFVPEGAVVQVPMDSRPSAIGAPSDVKPYVPEELTALPVTTLPTSIQIADEATQEDLARGGDVVVTLTWDNDADMDLYLTEPNGNTVYFGSPSSFSGAQLSQDANAVCASRDESIEIITWPTGQPRLGEYTVEVSEYEICDDGGASWELTVTIGGEIVLSESGTGEATFTFSR